MAATMQRVQTQAVKPPNFSPSVQVLKKIEIPYVQPSEVKRLVTDKNYEFWDLRTPEEHEEASKRYMRNVPYALFTTEGPRINPDFMTTLQRDYPNKMSRILFACDDGCDRSEMAYEKVAGLGYENIRVVKGGVWAILEVDPQDARDKEPRRRRR